MISPYQAAAVTAAAVLAVLPAAVEAAQSPWKEATLHDNLLPLYPMFSHHVPGERISISVPVREGRGLREVAKFLQGTGTGLHLSVVNTDVESKSAASLVQEVRSLLGLTWDRIASLLGVSPKTVYNWLAGAEVAEVNFDRVANVVATLRFIDRGNAKANHQLLLGTSEGGRTLLSLLSTGQYDVVRQQAGQGVGRARATAPLVEASLWLTSPDHFGRTLLGSTDDEHTEILPISMPEKRRAKARRRSL